MLSGKISRLLGTITFLAALSLPAVISAQEAAAEAAPVAEAAAEAAISPEVAQLIYAIDNLWLLLAAVLVFFMQAGFALVETGLNHAKNAVNILFKNLMDMSVGLILFFLVGYGFMYGEGNDFIGLSKFMLGHAPGHEEVHGTLSVWTDFFFQAAFAATAATIVSGAVAGRMKFSVYLIYSVIISAFIYPISGHWTWGGTWLGGSEGWLAVTFGAKFHDFAGSLIVHSIGGFAGLAGAIVLGPRMGKFGPDGKPQAMPGHNLTFAALGVFILFIGWFGFNPGSQLAMNGTVNTNAVAFIAVNTALAGAAGSILAMVTTWILYKKPELSMTLNGLLAGLVAITANVDGVSPVSAIIIGAIGGILVVFGVKLLDMLKIDDPVGAWPVHGLNGIWGGIAYGIFSPDGNFMAQLVGSLILPLWAFGSMFAVFYALKLTMGIRVTREEELKGLDISEHGEEGYKGFAIFSAE